MRIIIKSSRFYIFSVVSTVVVIIIASSLLNTMFEAIIFSVVALIYARHLLINTKEHTLDINKDRVLLNNIPIANVSYTLVAEWYVIMKFSYKKDRTNKIHSKVLFPDSIRGCDIPSLLRSQYTHSTP